MIFALTPVGLTNRVYKTVIVPHDVVLWPHPCSLQCQQWQQHGSQNHRITKWSISFFVAVALDQGESSWI